MKYNNKKEIKKKETDKKVPKGYHRMPNGKLMKGAKHKGRK